MQHMKILATALLTLVLTTALSQQGYEIKVTLKPFANQYIYLGHYFGKQLPIVDSVLLDANSQGVFRGNEKLGGGIYLVGFPDRARHFEILVDKNQHFGIIADTATLPKVRFSNSPENEQFKAYQESMNSFGKAMEELVSARRNASPADSIRMTREIDSLNMRISRYRNNIISTDPEGLLAILLTAMKEPEVPRNHPEAAKDSLFAWRYFKSHFWDGIYLWDDRLARTPFFESRVDKYFDQIVYPAADSVIKEMDWVMGFASASAEMEKFMLLKFINRYYTQKYMWEDAVFVHLFEKYFAQKNYPWLTEKGRKMITDKAYSLMANIFGKEAAEVKLPDRNERTTSLYAMDAPYTLLVIWDPTCGHCKEVLPKLDSFYRTKWKTQGVRMFALAKETDGTRQMWLDFIDDKSLNDWVHVYYSRAAEKKMVSEGKPGYSQLYDVQSFPTLYLLDKDKRIIAKKFGYEQVDEILQYRLKTN